MGTDIKFDYIHLAGVPPKDKHTEYHKAHLTRAKNVENDQLHRISDYYKHIIKIKHVSTFQNPNRPLKLLNVNKRHSTEI